MSDLPTVEWEPDESEGGWTANLGVVELSIEYSRRCDTWVCRVGWLHDDMFQAADPGATLTQAKELAVSMAKTLLQQGLDTLNRGES